MRKEEKLREAGGRNEEDRGKDKVKEVAKRFHGSMSRYNTRAVSVVGHCSSTLKHTLFCLAEGQGRQRAQPNEYI